MESDLERGEYIDPDSGKVMFGAIAAKWLDLRQVGASSRRRYESVYRLHVAPAFADRRVKSILPSEVRAWLNQLSETYSTSTQGTAYMILAGALDLAVADGLRRDNPAKSHIVRAPVPDTDERILWDTSRVLSVIDAHALAYRVVPVLAAGCGLRGGEAFAVAIEDFDLAAGKVTIRRQVTRVGGTFVFKAPKGGRERTAPLPGGVAAYVAAYLEAFPAARYELPWMTETGKLGEPRSCGLLVRWAGDDPRTHGKHVVASSFDQFVWKPVLASLGIIPPAAKDKRGIWRHQGGTRRDGLHMLRHWYASCLLDAGVSLSGVMEFLGHSRKGKPVTLGTYGHVTDETFAAARAAVDRGLFQLHSVDAEPVKIAAGGTVTELRSGR
jgi:integrase